MKNSPFKFLDSYSKEDRNIFFGRDREIEELHSRVFQSKILVVYGVSGTGKSSLINCGLANKFNDSDWLPLSIRRGININQSFSDCLVRNALDETSLKGKREAVKLIRSVYLDHFKPLFLIFDQFEEVFIFGTREEREEFIINVRKIIESDLQCRFIFSVREEYLAGFTEFEKVIASFLDNRIRIEKMTRQNALRAIEGPCEVYNIAVESGMSDLILEKLNPDSPDVELTYLQVYLDKIFRLAFSGDSEVSEITSSHVEKVGDVKDLLGTFLEEQISQLGDPDAGMVILKAFVSVKGTKHQITEEDVIDYSRTLGKEIDGGKVKDMIQKFIGLRILRDKDEHGRYELRHDSLASAIYEKITLVEKELLEIRQFIENSWNSYERRKLWLTASDLEYIAPYEDRLFLNEKLTRFVSQSKRIIHKAKRRRQNVAVFAAAIIFSVLSFFTIWAMKERKNAISQQVIAEQQKNAALSAMTVADSARREAVTSKDLALKNERIAVNAQEQSELARKEAFAQREIAFQQKNLSEKLSVESKEQARIAMEERSRAEHEKQKAIEAEETATRIGNLSKAQNFALSSMNTVAYESIPKLQYILAYQAYKYNIDNGGPAYDPVIYQALNNAWMVMDSSKHSLFNGSESEIWSIAGQDEKFFLSADLDGYIRRWSRDGDVLSMTRLNSVSPLKFIKLDPFSGKLITQHDNREVLIWNLSGKEDTRLSSVLLSSESSLRSVDFCRSGRFLATGGNDSIVRVWDILSSPVLIKSFEASSFITSVLFSGPDTIFYACGDGSVNVIINGKVQILTTFSDDKPLSMGFTDSLLIVGYQSGGIGVFSRKPHVRFEYKFEQHEAGIDLIAFSNDYKQLATAGRDKSIRLFYVDQYFSKKDIYGGIVHYKDLPGRVRSLAFTGDNKLVAGLSDKTIRIWETSSAKLAGMIQNFLKTDSVLTNK